MSRRPKRPNTAPRHGRGVLADNKTLMSDLTAQAGAAGADPAIAQALSEPGPPTAAADHHRRPAHGLRRPGFHGQFLETEASALDTATHSASETIRATAATFQDSVLPDITTSLDSLVEACGTLEGALRGLTPSLAEARAILGAAQQHADLFRDLAFHHVRFLGTMETNLEQSLTGLTTCRTPPP